MDIRAELGRRIQAEITRKGMGMSELALHAGVPGDLLSRYLDGTTAIRFAELRPLCEALEIPIMRLLTQALPSPVKIAYRRTPQADRKTVAQAEDVFLWLEEFLPEYRRPRVGLPVVGNVTDAGMLIAEVNAFVGRMKDVNPSLAYWYRTLGIAVAGKDWSDLPLLNEQAMDGLCLSSDRHTLVLVNTGCPNVRVQFTLLHELWHAICDRDLEIPADRLPVGLYDQNLSAESRPEFCANKFAQFWMVPFDAAETLGRKLRSRTPIASRDVEEAIQGTGASSEVLANAVYDVLRYSPVGRDYSYTAIRSAIQSVGAAYSGDTAIRTFVQEETRTLSDAIQAHLECFGPHALEAVGSFISLP